MKMVFRVVFFLLIASLNAQEIKIIPLTESQAGRIASAIRAISISNTGNFEANGRKRKGMDSAQEFRVERGNAIVACLKRFFPGEEFNNVKFVHEGQSYFTASFDKRYRFVSWMKVSDCKFLEDSSEGSLYNGYIEVGEEKLRRETGPKKKR